MPNVTRIIHIAQGETARTTEPDVALLTSEVSNCIVIIFIGIRNSDGKPYRSMTHVDFKNDSSFLKKEADKMKPGFKIFIVKNGKYNSDLADRYLRIMHKEKEESNYQFDFQEVKVLGESMWIKGEKILPCSKADLQQFSTGQWKPKARLSWLWKPENIQLEEGNRSVQLRHHQRSFLYMLHNEDTLPSVVYDDRWTKHFEPISDEIQSLLNDLRDKAKSTDTVAKIEGLVEFARPSATAQYAAATFLGHDERFANHYWGQLGRETAWIIKRMHDYNALLDKQAKIVNDSAASASCASASATAELKSDSEQPSPMMTPAFSASTSASLRNRTGALAEHTAAAPEASAMAPGSEPSAVAEAASLLPIPEDREQKPRKKKCCKGSCIIL